MNNKGCKLNVEFMIHESGGVFNTKADSLVDIKGGFWVTEDGVLIKESDPNYFSMQKYYILPHMIRLVERTENAE